MSAADLLKITDGIAQYGTLLLAVVAYFSLLENRRQGKQTAAALRAAEDQVSLARAHNLLSVRPFVVADVSLRASGGHFGVRNIGNGPALIDGLEMAGPIAEEWRVFDGERAWDTVGLLHTFVDSQIRVDTHALQESSPMGVPANAEPLRFLVAELPEGISMDPERKNRIHEDLRRFVSQIRFRVSFRSLYDQQDQIIVTLRAEQP